MMVDLEAFFKIALKKKYLMCVKIIIQNILKYTLNNVKTVLLKLKCTKLFIF